MSNFANLKRLNDSEFTGELTVILSTFKSLWGKVAGLAVQSILHYYEHGHDVSRCQQLYTCLEDSGAGGHLSAYQKLLRETTGITGIGGAEDWKGKGRAIPDDDVWQGHLQTLIDGEGVALMAYRGEKPSNRKGGKKAGERSATIAIPKDKSEGYVNASKSFVERISQLPEDQAIELMRNLGSEGENPIDSLPTVAMREGVRGFIDALNAEFEVGGEKECLIAIDRATGMVKKYTDEVLKPQIRAVKDAAAS